MLRMLPTKSSSDRDIDDRFNKYCNVLPARYVYTKQSPWATRILGSFELSLYNMENLDSIIVLFSLTKFIRMWGNISEAIRMIENKCCNTNRARTT